MTTIGSLCSRTVILAHAEDRLVEVARRMRDRHVGSLVVVDERDDRRYPIGVVTDRDLVVGAMAMRADEIASLQVSDLLERTVVTAPEFMEVPEAVSLMRAHGIRRLPIVDGDGVLQGLVTMDDLLAHLGDLLHGLTTVISREVAREDRERPPVPRPGM